MLVRVKEKLLTAKMRSLVVYLLLFFILANLTTGFVMRRAGCPSIPSNTRCPPRPRNLCSVDVGCGKNKRCCSNGCSLACIDKMAGLWSVIPFYDPFSYAAYGPFGDSFWR